jgi:DNA adenine methylase
MSHMPSWGEGQRLALAGALARVDARPIIKWAGGKWHLLPRLQRSFPPREQIRRYFEPFIGGAAVFFALQHPHSILSDNNIELINLYQVVRDHVSDLIVALQGHVNDVDHYYRVRAQEPATLTPIERAARLIYLNKTCYNGLYRVNRHGQFNVPFGRYRNPTICDAANLQAASTALQRATIRHGDYATVLRDAAAGDFIYFDPPYHPVSKTANFTSYTEGQFGPDEQARLAAEFARLHRAGCYVMASNSDTPLIRELYAGFSIATITANRAINCKANGRGPVAELVITNYVKPFF